MTDDCACPTDIDGVIARGGQRGLVCSFGKTSLMQFLSLCVYNTFLTSVFCMVSLATLIEPHDYVLDVFAGCGDLGRASAEDMRHCMFLELDEVLYEKCLSKMACGPVTC